MVIWVFEIGGGSWQDSVPKISSLKPPFLKLSFIKHESFGILISALQKKTFSKSSEYGNAFSKKVK